MENYKKILICAAIAIGLLLIVPFLIPMQTYLHKAEKIASVKLGQPVTIGSAHLLLLPSPRISASGIVVGKQQEFQVESLVVTPTISSLFSATKTVDLSISKPTIKKAALDFIAALNSNKSASRESAAVHVRQISVDELRLVWPDSKYPDLNLEATLTDANALESAVIETVDGKLNATVTPNGDEQLIVLNANKWTMPVGMPLLIDKAKLEMHLKNSRLNISNIDIALYGGKLTGDAKLSWDKSWKTSGNLHVENLAVQQPSRMVSKAVYLSGDLFGSGNFSSTAKDAGQIADNLHTNFQFKVNNGVLHGLDLVKVASLIIKQSQSGGDTQFDTFSGVLTSSGKQYNLHHINISSGLLAATGQVKVKPNKILDGDVVVDVKAGMGLAGIPLKVSGTLSNPVVLPSKAALAGAVAGTAILGPGVGTSLGVKAGSAVGKIKDLFGSKK
jgi:uncharacterized protein involved in outer membrane biogenesis